MPITPTECQFVYGFAWNDFLIYIGKTNNLLNRFIGHWNSGSIFGEYLQYIIYKKEKIELIIFGFHDQKTSDILERILIKQNADCYYMLNEQLREQYFKKSKFVEEVIKLRNSLNIDYIKIPPYVKRNLIIIQKNYIKRYATIEEPKEPMDYSTTISH